MTMKQGLLAKGKLDTESDTYLYAYIYVNSYLSKASNWI